MSVTASVEQMVVSAPKGSFIHSRDLPGSRGAADIALNRVVSRHDDVVRVRKGLYWKGAKTRFGLTRPGDMQVALEAAGTGAGPSGWSALAAIGATTQVPAREAISSLRPVTGIKVVVERRSNSLRASLQPLEIACLEASRTEWSQRADSDVAECIARLARSGKVRKTRLLEASRGESRQVEGAIRVALSS